MEDPVLRQLVASLENQDGCPITLVLSSAVVVGVAVKRADFFEALRELAKRTQRHDLKAAVGEATALDEVAGDFVHLLGAVVISGGQAVDSALTFANQKAVDATRPPMRVRVADVHAWHVGNVFEEARGASSPE